MDAYDLVLSVIANEPGNQVVGRTLLQKKIFFLKEMISARVRFFPHYYGPYSREVAGVIDSLVSAGLLKERAESYPLSDETPWGESTRYTYELVRDLKNIHSLLKEQMGKAQYSRIQNAVKRINDRPESRNYKALSIAAKVLQILNEKGEMRIADLPKEARRLRWKLDTNDVKKAASFLKGINLLS
jgi:hypothetical protein